MPTFLRNLKVGIKLNKGIKSGQSDINKKGFICLFHMFGGFNPVYEEPKSPGNVLHSLFTIKDWSVTLTFQPR